MDAARLAHLAGIGARRVIPGVAVYHPRTEWEQVGFRMAVDFTRLPTAMTIGNVDQMVAHYTGAKDVPDGDPGEDLTTMRDYLRAIERDYLTNRTGGGYVRKSDNVYFPGYHTGYSFAVDWQGGAWEIRGFDFLPAATNQHNGHTVAVLFFVDGADKANTAMWNTARAIGRETRRRANRADFKSRFTDHGTLTITSGTGTATACAGPGIRSQLATEGFIDIAPTPTPTPPPGDDDDMPNILWRPKGYKNVFITNGVQSQAASQLMIAAQGLNGAPVTVDDHKSTLKSVLAHAGLDLDDLTPEPAET